MAQEAHLVTTNSSREHVSYATPPRAFLRKVLPALLALVFFFIVTAILTWPRVPGLATSVVDYGDPAHHIWTLDWIDRTLFSDYSRLYDAPIYHGFPLTLAYDDIFIGPALSVMALNALTQNIDLSYNLFVVLEFTLAAWCVFLLARHVTKSVIGGLLAGMVVGFTSYTFAHLSHINLLAIYPLPLALLCLHQVFDAPRHSGQQGNRLLRAGLWVLAFLACSIWQALHSFYYAAYLALAAGALTLWEVLVVRRWRLWPRRWRSYIAGSLALAWALYLVTVWLLSEPNRAVQQEFGFRRSLEEQVQMSAQLTDYFAISQRNRTYARVLPKVDLDQALFPGFVTLSLGAVGVGLVLLPRRRKRLTSKLETDGVSEVPVDDEAISESSAPVGGSTEAAILDKAVRRRVMFYLVLAVIGVILSLGPVWDTGNGTVPLPYQFLWSLPGFEGLRGPRRTAVLALIGWGVLGAWGWRGISVVALDWGRRSTIKVTRSTSNSMSAVDDAGVASLPMGRFKVGSFALAATLLLLMMVEQWTVPTPSVPLPPPPEGYGLTVAPPAYTWLATQQDEGVVMEFPVLPGNALREFPIMYYQKIHRHPLINGLSSYQPEMFSEIMLRLDIAENPLGGYDFTPAQIGMLQTLEVRYMVFNELAYKAAHWQRIRDSLAKYSEVSYVGKYDLHQIYMLSPLPADAQLRLGWRVPATMTVGASVPITVSVVNPYSSLLLARLQPSLGLVANWQRREGAGQPSSQGTAVNQSEAGSWKPSGALFPARSIEYNSLLNIPSVGRTELALDTELLVAQGAHLFEVEIKAPPEPGEYLLQIFPKWRLPAYKIAPPIAVTVAR
jgi:hypothetical protein